MTARNDSKFVILIGHFGRGGSQRQAYLLGRHLRERHGLDLEVWALIDGGHDESYANEFVAAGMPVHRVRFDFPQSRIRLIRWTKWAWQLRRFARQLRKKRVAVLLPFTTFPNIVAGLAYRLAGVRVCIWGERSAGSERVPRFEQLAVRQYRRFVANSTAGVEFLAREMGVPRERISFVPNGVEFPEIDPRANWRQRLGLTPAQLLVVMVANVTLFKDHPTLLRAWKIVQDQWAGPDRPVLALAGLHAPDIYAQCEKIMRELQLESHVRFLGPVTDVGGLLAACDMTAFSSPKEGMPNGVLECMAAGKAVIASDLPGIRDALSPNAEDDVLVPPGDAGRFAQALLSLLRDQPRREAIGEMNLARIRSEFSVERMAERYLQIVQETWQPFPPGARRQGELLQRHDPI